MHVAVKELPDSIKSTLKAVGFHKADIEVKIVESLELSNTSFGDGYRGFSSIVNISTGQNKISYGSWGGENPFEHLAVDHDNKIYNLPEGMAVIKGQSGYKTFATLYLHPNNIIKGLLTAPKSLEKEELETLKIFNNIKPAYRKEYLEGKQSIVEKLISEGYLKKDGRGISITLSGKNAVSNK